MFRWSRWILAGLVASLAVGIVAAQRPTVRSPLAQRGVARVTLAVLAWAVPEPGADDEPPFVMPSGLPPMITCDEARLITAQVRDNLAGVVPSLDAKVFGEATADWLDPHGLWSVAKDSPVGPALAQHAAALLAELQAPVGSGPCRAAARVGAEMSSWSDAVRGFFEESYRAALLAAPRGETVGASGDAWRKLAASPYEEGPVTRTAVSLAHNLGRSAAIATTLYGDAMAPFVDAARERSAPRLGVDGWTAAILAAALRAYVPQLDAHGAWAPLDEEVSIYDLDLETAPPPRMWGEMTRSTLGVRIDSAPLAPLQVGDLVLQVGEVKLAGVSIEQAQQLGVLPTRAPTPVTVLREGPSPLVELLVTAPAVEDDSDNPPHELAADFVRYGNGTAAIVRIIDVPDDLGREIKAVLARVRNTPNVLGIALDLRANSGGSTDGAADALGYFLSGATLFPMRRRDGGIEIERAPEVPADQQYTGPLAVLVDGDSASAAEMIAGAIAAYQRGVVIGEKTYGKGCAQEYLDDEAHVGVLRLTTLLYALPDGSPVQKVGITPDVALSLPGPSEREATVTQALGPWRGPDVRDKALIRGVSWPPHGGQVGPCKDEALCRALRVLGTSRAAVR